MEVVGEDDLEVPGAGEAGLGLVLADDDLGRGLATHRLLEPEHRGAEGGRCAADA